MKTIVHPKTSFNNTYLFFTVFQSRLEVVVHNFGDLFMRNPCHGLDSSVESVTSQFGTRSPAYQASGTLAPLFSTPSLNVLVTGGYYH
jgi:hypothetical protein